MLDNRLVLFRLKLFYLPFAGLEIVERFVELAVKLDIHVLDADELCLLSGRSLLELLTLCLLVLELLARLVHLANPVALLSLKLNDRFFVVFHLRVCTGKLPLNVLYK